MFLLCCRLFATVFLFHFRTIPAVLMLFSVTPVAAYALASPEAGDSPPIEREAFATPPSEFRPWLRWWWPGNDVEKDELAQEVGTIASAGFGGAEIQSFAVGLPGNGSPDVFAYGSPEWFGNVGSVLDEAEKHGIKIDLTFGSSWPSGGRNIDLNHSLKQLTFSSQLLSGQMELNQLPPPPREPLYYELGSSLLLLPNTYDSGKMRLTGLLAFKRDTARGVAPSTAESTIPSLPPLPGTIYLEPDPVNLSPYLQPDGKIKWNVPSGEWVIFAFYQGPTGLKPFYGADGDGGLVLDHLHRESTELHLTAIADRGKAHFGRHFGKTLRALFVDSLELRTELYWTEAFADQFAQRRGYRIEAYLPVLFRPFQSDAYLWNVYTGVQPAFDIAEIGERVRQDYDLTVAELMLENFIDPVSRWASLNSMSSRIQAHGGPFDLLNAYGHAYIPETEGLYSSGKPSFLKIASSAAHIFDRPTVSSEILAFKNRAYMTSPADIIREANRNFSAGINHLVLHGFPYRYDAGFSPPGWMPFCSTFFPAWSNIGTFATHLNDRDPFWEFMPQVTGYLARAQMILRAGRPTAGIALFAPLPAKPEPSLPDPGSTLELDRSGYSYDYVNGDLLKGATVQNGRLIIGAGEYQALVVADTSIIPWELAVKIPEYVKAGIPVIFTGNIPSKSRGFSAYEIRDQFVRSQFQTLFGASSDRIQESARYQSGKALYLATPDRLGEELRSTFSILPEILFPNGGNSVTDVHRRVGNSDFHFLVNTGNIPIESKVSFINEVRTPELWDLVDGTVKEAPVYGRENGGITLPIRLEAGAAVVVGFETESARPHAEKTTLAAVGRNADGTLTGRVSIPGSYEVWYGPDDRAVVKAGEGLPLLSTIYIPSWDLTARGTDLFGSPSSVTLRMEKLTDWWLTPGLEYFSGEGSYTATVRVPDGYLAPGVGVELELGTVHDACRVVINGKEAASLPEVTTRVNISPFLQQGANTIQIIVTNTLRNHLLGLASKGNDYYKPLLLNPLPAPSGLLGPVLLIPHYLVPLDGSTASSAAPPFPFGLNVVPMNYPDYTEQDVIDAIVKSQELTGNISLSWFWWDNMSGNIRDCAKVTPLVQEAQRRQMQVTLQVLSFTAFGEPLVPYTPASFSNPEAKNGFLGQMKCLAGLRPDYLLVAPEVNFVREFNPREFNLFREFYGEIYKAVKEISPSTQVGVSYQYDFLWESGKWEAVDEIGPNQDFIGMTSYFDATPTVPSTLYPPRFTRPSEVPANYYSGIRQNIPPEKPVVFSELAWSSYYPDGLDEQADFLKRIPDLLKNVNPVNTIWALEYDVSYYTGFLTGLNYIGLMKRDGTVKPAWEEAKRLKNTGVFGPRLLK